jgi:hypothetical protein
MIARWRAWRHERAMNLAARTIRRRLEIFDKVERTLPTPEAWQKAYEHAMEQRKLRCSECGRPIETPPDVRIP